MAAMHQQRAHAGTTASVPRLAPLAVAAAISLIPASTAGATTLTLPDGTARPEPYQGWVDNARVPTPAGSVTLDLGGCGELEACAPEGAQSISLAAEWANPHVLLHELGHVFDDTMPASARDRFQAIMRKRGAWASASSRAPANEQFAEAYSLCARHVSIKERYAGGYDYSPTPAQHRQVCAVIRQAAGAAR
jgi:hypothetical protein